jgi:hypothetical protein
VSTEDHLTLSDSKLGSYDRREREIQPERGKNETYNRMKFKKKIEDNWKKISPWVMTITEMRTDMCFVHITGSFPKSLTN